MYFVFCLCKGIDLQISVYKYKVGAIRQIRLDLEYIFRAEKWERD